MNEEMQAVYSPSMNEGDSGESRIQFDEPLTSVDLAHRERISICGDDNRLPVTNAELTRIHRSICHLLIWFPKGQTFCTGFVTGRRAVLTAGHCVYNHEAGGWAHGAEIIPARDGDRRPYGSQYANKFGTTIGWAGRRDFRFDIGAVFLPSTELTDRLGEFIDPSWIEAATAADMEPAPSPAPTQSHVTAGYPGDKPYGTMWRAAAGAIVAVERRGYTIRCQHDLMPGQSGSPFWSVKTATQEVRLRGVVSWEPGDHSCPNGVVNAFGTNGQFMRSWSKYPDIS